MNSSVYSTRCTWLGQELGYGCRVFVGDKLLVEGRARTREDIGPTFRDLVRSVDKLGGDEFTSASRHRGDDRLEVKHIWS